MANEVKVFKNNTLEDWRQKTNEVSFDLGDNSNLDNTRLSDKVFTYTATTANGGKFIGGDNNGDSLTFSLLPDVTLDNTSGYIILKDSTSIPVSFAVGDTLSQSGGFTCTLVAISTVDNKPKLLIKNSSGTLNTGQDLTDGTGTIAHANIIRLISESYSVGSIRVLKDSAELTQDLSSNGFHIIPLAGLVPLLNTPDVSEFHEGDFVFQGSSAGNATWSGTLYHASSTTLTFKTVTGTFNASTVIKNSSTSDTITGVNHGNITNYAADGFGVELNTPAANTNVITIVATDLVDAVNELQDDIGTVENLQSNYTTKEVVTALNKLDTDLFGTGNSVSFTGLSADGFQDAIEEVRAELGDHTEINDATGYSATTAVGGIKEIQGDIGDVTGLGTDHKTTLVGSINEIEGVFDASAKKIISTPDFTLDVEGDIILDADGGDILFKDNGTSFGKFTNGSGSLHIVSQGSDNDIKFFGNDGGSSVTALTLDMSNAGRAIFNDSITAVGTSVFTNLDISGNVDIDGSLETDALSINGTTVSSTAAELNILDGATLSTSELNILDGATLSTNELNILDGVTASAADINLIDGITNGTVSASKAIITDSNKDITGGRNITISGELDAATLDISGNADIDGTLALGSLANVETSITDLQSDVGSNNFTGGTLLNSLGGTSSLTVAIKTLESEIGEDADYASGTITFGANTISGVLVNLNNELDALNALTLTAGDGLSGGGNLTQNRSFAVNVDDSSIEINSDSLRVKAGGITSAMLAGSIAPGKLSPNIPVDKLQHSSITISAESGTDHAIVLGETLTVSAGAGINTDITDNTLTISAELATETNAGVATFDGTDFTVTSGDVTLNDERIEDIVGAMVSGNTEDGIAVSYVDNGTGAGKLNFDIDDTSVLRLAGAQTVTGNKTFTGNVDLSGATVTFGSGGSVQNFNTQFLTLNADTNISGLRIDRSANTSATLSTTVDADFFWDETQVGTGASNTSHRGWRLKGFSNASTPIANTADVVTFYNAKDLISNANSSGVTATFTMDTGTAGEHQGIWDIDVNVDNSSIEVSGDNLRVKALGITNAMLADNAVDTDEIADDAVTNAKLANSSLTIGNSTIALGGSDTTLTGLTDLDLTAGNKTIFDGVGENNLTIGASTTTVKIAGNLEVEGSTTTISTNNLEITDKEILLGKGSTNSANSDGTGIKFGDYAGAAKFLYEHTGTKLVSNKDVEAPNFRGALVGDVTGDVKHGGSVILDASTGALAGNANTATTLASSQDFKISGDITASAVSFNGSGEVDLVANIDANTINFAELNAGTATTGQVLAKKAAGSQIEFIDLPASDNYSHWVLQADSGSNDNITTTEVVDFQGGNAISTVANANGVEIKLDSNSIAVDELACADGTAGQVLQTDGNGTLSFGSVSTTNNFVTGLSFNTSNGILTATRQGLTNLTVDLDGRYATTDTNTFRTIKVDTTNDGNANVTLGATEDLQLIGGSNVTLSEADGVITITSTDTNTQLTTADVRGKFSAGEGIDINAGVISGEDATATNKGIAKFSTANFAVSSGNVTIKDGGVDNAELVNDSITINGTAVALGQSITIADNNDNTTYSLKAQQTGGNNTNPNIFLDASTGTDDAIQLVGAGATTVTRNSDGQITISSTDNNDDTNTQNQYNISAHTHADGAQARLNGSGHDGVTADNILFKENGATTIIAEDANTIRITSTDTNTTDWDVANSSGATQFTVNAEDKVRFEGTGGTTVSFSASTNKIVINSTDNNDNDIDFIDGASFNTSNGILSLTGVGNAGATVDLDGRFIQLGEMDISITHNASNVVVNSSQGDNGTINAATTSVAGVMTSADKTKLDGIDSGANENIAGSGIVLSNNNKTISIANDHRIGSTSADSFFGNTSEFVHADADVGLRFYSGAQEGARLEENGDLHVKEDVIAFSTTVASDKKLKENVQVVNGALELVSQLDGVTFDWKESGKNSAGVIAQDVEKVLPSAVKEVENMDKTDTHKVVDYNQLSALFIEAIKELKEENKILKDEIENLKSINS